MTKVFMYDLFKNGQWCKLSIILGVLIFATYIGDAHSAKCGTMYYLADGECVRCYPDLYINKYCPGDDTIHECPIDPNKMSYYEELYNGIKYYHTYQSMLTHGKITDCYLRLELADDMGRRFFLLGWDEEKGNYSRILNNLIHNHYYIAETGYYLAENEYTGASLYKTYKYSLPCTNAPANAHYTGAGTPDVGNCPWECDDGFGHTYDDRCLPLCRIG
ncbi:MAG: hypothetical protein IJ560_02770 [Alphaproteobacteria bacterium]|nr:hypothetical protein [Alphaproteobacteria bacterium]